jgi:hypothetical protein
MGKNWNDYIKEAKRCLVTNGILMIAETTKSLKGRLSKLRDVIKAEGFETYIDDVNVYYNASASGHSRNSYREECR